MEMFTLSLPATNKFATGYIDGLPDIQRFFHYQYQDPSAYKDRLNELNARQFMRKELVHYIEKFMEPFPGSKEVEQSLSKLSKENSVVVIGGQQAGILTGPLYSIHKIVSIITFARQKEKELNIPVVPVFWIAGEDHDFQEVNHIYIEKDGEVEKVVYPEKDINKKMVSDIAIDRDICKNWVKALLSDFGETEYSKSLLSFMENAIDHSVSYVDFFAYIVMEIFKDQGLLIIDSGDIGLRRLEKEIFLKQIDQAQQITNSVKIVQKEIETNGFNCLIEISDTAANLFYYDDKYKERVLLEYDPDRKLYVGKSGVVHFSQHEIMQIANEFPERLSNNVVTRPLTQELLFPTLAFIAGPGEIAYWAELKNVFETFLIKMPPIVPRLNITLLERSIERDIQELNLSIEKVMLNGTEKEQETYLSIHKDQDLENLFQFTKDQLEANYQLIEEKLEKGLTPLLKKNQSILLKQIEFMESKIDDSLKERHEIVLNRYKKIEHSLRPLNAPQERILNALYFMNKYGMTFLGQLAELSYRFDGNHNVIKI